VDPRAGLDDVEKRQFFQIVDRQTRKIDLRSLVIYTVFQRKEGEANGG
jgi:hypothetical protein